MPGTRTPRVRTRALISVAIAWGASSCEEGGIRDADLVEQPAALTWGSNVTLSGTDVLAFLGNTYLAQVAQSGGTGGFWNVGVWELPWTVDSRMRFADFTGDGKTDVLAHAGTNQAQVARSAGTSGFSNVGIWTLPSASFDAMRFFDDDRDGFADLILQVPSGFRVYRNLGGTGFSMTSTLYVTD